MNKKLNKSTKNAVETVKRVFEGRKPEGRAATYEDKRRVMEQVLAAWAALPELRLGQLLCNVGYHSGMDDLFYIEDEKLAEQTMEYVKALSFKE